MFFRNGRKSSKGPALPWGSIVPRKETGPTKWDDAEDGAEQGEWFLEAPKGASWEMEAVNSADDEAEDDKLVAPFETLPEEEPEDEESYPPRAMAESGAWTISVLCMGLGLIAACLIIPQTDANRRLVFEREKMRLDLAQVKKQIAVNSEFLAKMESDPQLTERLAQREMHAVKEGESIVDVSPNADSAETASASAERMSPFNLVKVPPPPALEPYREVGGNFAELCRNPRTHIYVLGAAMIFVAGGLVLGGPTKANEVTNC